MAKQKINKGINKDFEKATEALTSGSPKMVNNLTILRDFTSPSVGALPITSGISDGPTIVDITRNAEQIAADYEATMRQKYSYLMETDISKLISENYWVSENGSIFKGTFDYSTVYLPIQNIQKIENEAGNPGALLLHMQKPAIAKDTAGYEGGSSGTFNGQPPVVQPIPDVQVLPPVVKTDAGVTFEDGTTDIPQTSIPDNTTTQQGMFSASGKYYWLWYALAALAIILFLKYGRK
jgi:hypothetical protein